MTVTTRPSLTQRMAEGYLMAAVFALEAAGAAGRTVQLRGDDIRRMSDRPGLEATRAALDAALGVAVLARERWRDEAERCEAICVALSGMVE